MFRIDLAQCQQELTEERRLARLPMPGQDALFDAEEASL
jgi:hypothetical protein